MINNEVLRESNFFTLVSQKCSENTLKCYLDAAECEQVANFNELEWFGFKYAYLLKECASKKGFLMNEPDEASDRKGAASWTEGMTSALNSLDETKQASVAEGVELFKSVVLAKADTEDLTRLADYIVHNRDAAFSSAEKMFMASIGITDHWNVGIVNPWPGDMSAEAEVLTRMKRAADAVDMNLIMLSNFGYILDSKTQEQTETFVDDADLDFVISTHYDTPKTVDAMYYHTLWNPPEIPLNLDEYPGRVADNYMMNDDFLIYDEGGMSGHLECMMLDKPRNLEDASSLTASFPSEVVLEPNLKDPKMFYCGMNWERVTSKSGRHEGLFKLLDDTGKVKFFGPDVVKAWGGIRPWEGYKCYQYSIPFDGFSILREINACGICLVLSSDIHRRAGAATNRTYEACAAGAVIISDDNPFMKKYFKDAALFIDYNKNDPQDTFQQLMEKYNWVVAHPKEALEMARKAQRIFLENFALDDQLKRIMKNHPQRLKAVNQALYARNTRKKVVVLFVLNTLKMDEAEALLDRVLINVKNQLYPTIQLMVAADNCIADRVSAYCKERLYSCQVFGMELFDYKKSRFITDAQAIRRLLHEAGTFSYFINTRAEEHWFRDHITTLVRTIEDGNAPAAYSGRLFEDKLGYRRTDMFRPLDASCVNGMCHPNWLPVPGQILFTAEVIELLPECMDAFLDGYEHYALLNLMIYKHKMEPAFSRRMSFNYMDGRIDERCSVMPSEMQIRLIRDTVRNYLISASVVGASSISAERVVHILNWLPLQHYIPMRIERVLLRLLPNNSKLYDSVAKKYNMHSQTLLHHFD